MIHRLPLLNHSINYPFDMCHSETWVVNSNEPKHCVDIIDLNILYSMEALELWVIDLVKKFKSLIDTRYKNWNNYWVN